MNKHAELVAGRSAAAAGHLRPAGLANVRQLLDQLHDRGIVYCHWKSNEHVGPAVEAATDLDILVERRQQLDLERCLAECGFKRFTAASHRRYPAVEDYLGFDTNTGRLAHLHLHHRLTLGQKHLKGYRLPWEDRVLARRVFDVEHGIYVSDPAMETVLLVVRDALKRRIRDVLRPARDRSGSDYRRELAWLLDRADAGEIRGLAADLLGPEAASALAGLLEAPDSPRQERQFARAVRPALRRHRSYGPLSAVLRAWSRELQWLADAVNRRILHRPVPLRRVDPRGGVVIAFLGSDGAGKSTLVKSTTGWLGRKLDVMPLYFGSGDGPASMLRLPLKLARDFAEAARSRGRDADSRPEGDLGPGEQSRLRSLARVPWALTLSFEKRAKLRRMTEARNRGMIVVCDRFPQADVLGFNDGPLLHHLQSSRWRLARMLAAWEGAPYRAAGAESPDLVVKLVASPAVALERRPDMSEQEIVRRIVAVRTLTFPGSARVKEVSGDEAIQEVTLAVRRIVWQEL